MANVEPNEFTARPLTPDTWDAFAALCERHNGVFGGCWCTWFHTMHAEKEFTYEGNRALKRRLVDEGRAHAALVMDSDEAVAWCNYGSPDELPNIKHRKQYEEETDLLPDDRLVCMFVDKRYRRQGLLAVALRGALELIGKAGGGVVEGYPHDTGGVRKKNSSFLYNGTRTMYEREGFTYDRPKGQGNSISSRDSPIDSSGRRSTNWTSRATGTTGPGVRRPTTPPMRYVRFGSTLCTALAKPWPRRSPAVAWSRRPQTG